MAHEQHKDRLLALTEAEAVARELASLTATADHNIRECDLPKLGDTLVGALTVLRQDASDRYTFGESRTADVNEFIAAALPAVRDRLDTEANRLAAALGALTTLQGILTDLPTGGMGRDWGRAIAHTAARFGTDNEPESFELWELWKSLAPSTDTGVTAAAANLLRRRFDTEIVANEAAWEALDAEVSYPRGPGLPPQYRGALHKEVARWRRDYLESAADWTSYDTYLYAARRDARWDALTRLWDRLAGADHPLTASQRMRVRETIADHIRDRSTTPHRGDEAYTLWQYVNDFDTNGTALSARIRLAEAPEQLARPFAILRRKWAQTGDGVALLTAAARKADHLAGTEGAYERFADESEAAADLRAAVAAWRHDLFRVASSHATDTADRFRAADGEHWITFTPEYLSSVLYYAMQTSVDAGDRDRVAFLLADAATAHERGRYADDKYEIVKSIAAKLATAEAAE